MDTNIAYRISEVIKHTGLNQKTFAERIDTTDTSLRYWLNGTREPRYSQIVKIVNAFPDIDECWLFTGRGNFKATRQMFNEDNNEAMVADRSFSYTKHNICSDCPFKSLMENFQMQIDELRSELKKLNSSK